MTNLIALALTLVAADIGTEPSGVTGLSVSPKADRTEVVILVDGTVSPRHFMLPGGRVVLDLTGVAQAPALDLRDFNRGGIRELRVAQYQPGVGRIVIALADSSAYEFSRDGSRISISFPNRSGAFTPWTHGAAAADISAPQPAYVPAAVSSAPRDAVAAPATTRSSAQVQQPQQQPVITVQFTNEPVQNVLDVFAEFAGRTILAAPEVQGNTITARIDNVPWDQALDAILEQYGMAIRMLPSGVLLVQDAAAIAAVTDVEPIITRTFAIQYISADSIVGAVSGLLQGRATVTANPSTNTLLVQGPESAVLELVDIIPQLDVMTPQVDIQATIAFIDRTTLEAMGVIYDLKDSRGNQLNRIVTGGVPDEDGVMVEATDDVILLGGNSVAALGNANMRVAGPALELVTSLVLGRHSLIAFLEALQTISLSDIQAKPYVRVMNHRRASIQVGEQTPIRTIDAGATGGGQAPRATVDLKDTGVILEVTPHITGNQILLELRAERSNVGAVSSEGVTFQTQNATTQVLVEDGETVVIGGLTIVEKTKTRSGIPLLMDLPVIGALFRNETTRENKRDLLIMVKPQIVRD